MARPDFYVILGVRRDDTPARIRAAYRALAKRHHPDRAGSGTTPRFQEIAEAYRTLADPARRRAYNAALDEAAGAGATPEERSAPEPIRVEAIDPFDPSASVRPSWEALQERYLRNFTGGWAPKSELVEGLNLEVLLSAEEALRGVEVPIEVPTLQACDACEGEGHVLFFPCAACGRTGRLLVPETVLLHLRPPVLSGTAFEIPLDHLGVHNFYLRVLPVVQ